MRVSSACALLCTFAKLHLLPGPHPAPWATFPGGEGVGTGLQGKICVVVGVLGGGGAAGDAAEGVVAEAAAAVVAGDDAAELADHRFIVNFPRELAIGTVAVDLLSEQHGAAAFL